MTDWIDKIASALGASEKQRANDYRVRLIEDEVIQASGPKFIRDLSAACEVIAKELDEKLGGLVGGLVCSATPNQIYVGTKMPRKASVTIVPDMQARDIKATYEWNPGGPFAVVGSPHSETYRFRVDNVNGVYLMSEENEKFFQAERLASHILQKTFKADLFRQD